MVWMVAGSASFPIRAFQIIKSPMSYRQELKFHVGPNTCAEWTQRSRISIFNGLRISSSSLKYSGTSSASLVYDERHALHDDQSHPEKSSRATKMWEALELAGLTTRCKRVPGREATREELALAHTSAHIHAVNSGQAVMDESTYFTPGSPLAARVAAGCVLEMTRQVYVS